MSFLKTVLDLPGANKNTRPLKECDRCFKTVDPSGGVDMGKKWICVFCWQQKLRGK